ncbi:MAG: cation:proton antiporter, partial [Terriglobales bacterium]
RLPIPDHWRHLLAWGGLRGALVMAMALSLPLDFPDREMIINLTFGVVLFTLLVPGLTMGPLVRVLGMMPKDTQLRLHQKWKALVLVHKAELQKLGQMLASGDISASMHDVLSLELQHQITEAQKNLDELTITDHSLDDLHLRQARIQLIEFRKEFLSQLAKHGKLNHEELHSLRLADDTELDSLEAESSNNESLNGSNTLVESDKHDTDRQEA